MLIKCGSALLDTCAVACVVIRNHGDVGRCAGVHKRDACFRDVALICDLKGSVAVSFAIECLVRIVEALGFVLRIEMGALTDERLSELEQSERLP